MSDEVYTEYINFVDTLTDLNTFKNNAKYTYMLEHVSQAQGLEYYNLLKTEFGLSDKYIFDFCNINDSIGSPNKYIIANTRVSPTSLRYLYQASLILKHYSNKNIVELGCGYGGLCLAIDYVSKHSDIKIKKYTCIDLLPATKLQQKYLSKFSMKFDTEFVDATTYGKNIEEDSFLISNYCFSELAQYRQVEYIKYLFPKISGGFIAWNMIPLYNFGKNILKVETERPVTGPNNLFVYF